MFEKRDNQRHYVSAIVKPLPKGGFLVNIVSNDIEV